jgi:hypothetical protein
MSTKHLRFAAVAAAVLATAFAAAAHGLHAADDDDEDALYANIHVQYEEPTAEDLAMAASGPAIVVTPSRDLR